MAKINKQALASALNSVGKALPAKNGSIPAIDGVLFEGDGETVTLTATDLGWTCQARLKQPHLDAFSVVLPAESIGAASSLPDDTLELYVASDLSATISAGRSRYMFKGISGEDFPRLTPPNEAKCGLTLGGAALKSALLKVLPAVSRDESKATFQGVLLTLKDGTLTLCASDTFRVARAAAPVQNHNGDGATSFLVPAKVLGEIIKIMPASNDVRIEFSEKTALFCVTDKDKELVCSVRLMDEKFPDVERFFPSGFISETTVNVGEALSAVSRVNIVANNASLTLKGAPDELSIMSESIKGRAEETVSTTSQNGEFLDVDVSARFLADGLKAISGAACVISQNGKSSTHPLILNDSDDPGYKYMILPISRR